MPSFQDSAVIFIIALLLFGPRKLPELARQLGKLMGEFRRASNDFRMQMEDELRMTEQAERQKEIAAIEAAAPKPAQIAATVNEYPPEEHPHLPSQVDAGESGTGQVESGRIEAGHFESGNFESAEAFQEPDPIEPLPIASSGELKMMPPSTGLPMARGAVSEAHESALTPLLDAIPEAPATASPEQAEFAGHTIHAPGTVNTEGSQADQHG